MRLRTSLIGMLTPPILGLAVACVVSLVATRFVDRRTSHLREQALPQLQQAYELQAAFQELDAGVNRAPSELEITKVQSLQSGAAKAEAELKKLIEQLSAASHGQPALEKPLGAITPGLAAYDQAAGKVFNHALQLLPIEAAAALEKEAVPARVKVAASIGELIAAIRQNADAAAREAANASRRGSQWLAAIAALAILTAGVLSFILARKLVHHLGTAADRLNVCAERIAHDSAQVTSSSHIVAEGASQQAATLEETSASLEEIASMTKRNADNAANGKDLSHQTRGSATSGLERISEMSRTLTTVQGAVTEMESAVSQMQSSSQEIAKIIKTIDEIAFQTNLLALNAAVEAARAGEAGAGFAVVADEVRALAQRSAQAARDTSEKIEAAVKRSAVGAVASQKVVASLGEIEASARNIEQVFNGIVTQVKSLDEVIAEIAGASKEQSQGLSELNLAVNQMDKVTQTNAASAEENASASEELSGQAATLQEVVNQLQQVVTGQAGDPRPPLTATAAAVRPASAPQEKPTPPGAKRSTAPPPVSPAPGFRTVPQNRDLPMPEAIGSGPDSFKNF
jgi:methyl-accepting chemotaxis protein